ncbi:XRE family transcriptional regulator [Nocardia amikacinitolerans]|uniref:XRE family transcriptional regulator n=1 Tax=Nocardia amikacinitolerans TaxID=756689 RepID=UPI00367AF771
MTSRQIHPVDRQIRLAIMEQIAAVLAQRGLSGSAAAAELGVTHTEVSNIKNKRAERFSVGQLLKLADRLDLNFGFGLSLIDPPWT